LLIKYIGLFQYYRLPPIFNLKKRGGFLTRKHGICNENGKTRGWSLYREFLCCFWLWNECLVMDEVLTRVEERYIHKGDGW
jgi:hypothetical protein